MLERLWFQVARESDVDSVTFATSLLGVGWFCSAPSGGRRPPVTAARTGARGLSLGQMRDGQLECPYHGWRFNHAGVCTLVPSQPGAHPLAGLETVPAQTAYGLVWACLDEPYLPMPSIPEMADDPDDGWETGFGTPFEVRCGLRSITENFRDSSHFAFVHKGCSAT